MDSDPFREILVAATPVRDLGLGHIAELQGRLSSNSSLTICRVKVSTPRTGSLSPPLPSSPSCQLYPPHPSKPPPSKLAKSPSPCDIVIVKGTERQRGSAEALQPAVHIWTEVDKCLQTA